MRLILPSAAPDQTEQSIDSSFAFILGNFYFTNLNLGPKSFSYGIKMGIWKRTEKGLGQTEL